MYDSPEIDAGGGIMTGVCLSTPKPEVCKGCIKILEEAEYVLTYHRRAFFPLTPTLASQHTYLTTLDTIKSRTQMCFAPPQLTRRLRVMPIFSLLSRSTTLRLCIQQATPASHLPAVNPKQYSIVARKADHRRSEPWYLHDQPPLFRVQPCCF